ncbi:MAG: diadenylate cyclase CdaA [Clostridia bacterium]|nr:diadenylate cyclase CdaA [Clostridia bacterium]
MNSILNSFKIFYETKVLAYINTLLEYPIKIVVLLVDLAIVGYIVYKVIKLLKGTRAMQLVKGIIILVIGTALSEFLSLNVLHYLLSSIMTYGVLVAIVVFQPELRKALEQVGNANFKKILDFEETDEEPSCIDAVVDAVTDMASHKVGALIVFEREVNLEELVKTGVAMDSKTSKELLINIFVPDTPLHDGAVIIRDNKIVAASCILPLTSNISLDRIFGTRHRAAIGVTESSDCIAVVASEETGALSLAIEGKIIRDISSEQLRKELKRRLVKPKKNVNHLSLKRRMTDVK